MAYVKTNQASSQLPEQIKIFKIINAKTDAGTCQRQIVKSTLFKSLWSSTNLTAELNTRCWNFHRCERIAFRHRVKVAWYSPVLHKFTAVVYRDGSIVCIEPDREVISVKAALSLWDVQLSTLTHVICLWILNASYDARIRFHNTMNPTPQMSWHFL